jgi:hypothetical protein
VFPPDGRNAALSEIAPETMAETLDPRSIERGYHRAGQIGTNSLPSDKPCVIIAGMKKLVAQVFMIWPRARIFMLEVPPRGQDLKFRNDVRLEVNSAIREMPSIKPIDVDDAIACAWQTPCENYNADGLHFAPAGYKILTKLLREALSQ